MLAVSSAVSSFKSVQITIAPKLANLRDINLPIPLPAPVINKI